MHNRNLLHEQGTHVATVGVVLEYFRRQGLSALEVKKLFSPDAVDAWFKAKADAFERAHPREHESPVGVDELSDDCSALSLGHQEQRSS